MAGELGLPGGDVNLVVMQRVQSGGGGRGHPGGVGAGAGMADLLLQHLGHPVGRGPHALADLRPAAQAAGEADIDVAVLVGLDPGGVPHLVLADHRAGFHRGVDLVAGAVEEAGVDEDDPVGGGGDAGGEVGAGAALLVHDAHFQRVRRQAEHGFDAGEDLGGEGDLVGAVHLRLDDVDRAGAAVLPRGVGAQIVDGDHRGDRGVEHAFGHFLASVEHGVGVHVVADIADQHEAAAGQGELAAARAGVFAVRLEPPGQGLAVLLEAGGQVALHQAEPVAIDVDLVGGVDGGDAVLEVLDGGDGGFEDEVGDAGRVGGADLVLPVDADLEVDAVVAQQDGDGRGRFAAVADELRRGRRGRCCRMRRRSRARRRARCSRWRRRATRRRAARPGRGTCLARATTLAPRAGL